jgi:hypothetical protein
MSISVEKQRWYYPAAGIEIAYTTLSDTSFTIVALWLLDTQTFKLAYFVAS